MVLPDTSAVPLSLALPCRTFSTDMASTKAPPGAAWYHQRSYFTTGSAAVSKAPTSVIIQVT